MPEPRIPLKPQFHYHIYNHAVGKENLFTTDSDYLYFLAKLKEYILPICDLFAYCLMPNHFHLIVRVKDESEIEQIISKKTSRSIDFEFQLKSNPDYFSDSLSKIFSNFLNTYAKHYNYKRKRQGSLSKRLTNPASTGFRCT